MSDDDPTIIEAPLFLDPDELNIRKTRDYGARIQAMHVRDYTVAVSVDPKPCVNLWRFLDGMLSDNEAAAFDQHRRECMACCVAVQMSEKADRDATP